MQKIKVVEFTNYKESVAVAFNEIGADKIFAEQKQIIIKPNLVDNLSFPVTTSAECIAEIIDYIKNFSPAKIIIGEGTGSAELETTEIFKNLGYEKLAQEKNVQLLDLNHQPLVKLTNPSFKIFPEYYIPKIALESFILSVPVLKAHSLAKVTLSLKNMMGFAPPKYYQKGGHWKKSFFHQNMQESIIEINAYRSSDLTLLDATVGMAEYHLGGKKCNPPVNKIVAGINPVEVDKIGAELLGFKWTNIAHISSWNKYS